MGLLIAIWLDIVDIVWSLRNIKCEGKSSPRQYCGKYDSFPLLLDRDKILNSHIHHKQLGITLCKTYNLEHD